ncbi:MAG: class I SAM-dependent methyltransferase [Alphaproteobacteria bacterium]
MEALPRRKHREVIEKSLALDGARVADIGCGDGALTRLMTRLGARVTGIEPSENQLARARAAEPPGEETYLQGVAEELPLPDAGLDIAVFFNSLHHVPVEHQAKALTEAARALKPGGRLCVVEPLAQGPHFQANLCIEDETEVRDKAYLALRAAFTGPDFEADREFSYMTAVRYRDFETFRDGMIAVDERRREAVAAREAELRAAFEANAEPHDGKFTLDQPIRLNLLIRA